MKPKLTKTEQAYIKLRNMILGGQFAAGNHWTVRLLAKELDFSPLTINQALQRLQQDGLIDIRPQSGISLRYMDKKERTELNILRQALEVQAARLLSMKSGKTGISALRQLARRISNFIEKGNYTKAHELDYEFHVMMVKKANCRPLTETFERIISICMIVPDLSQPWHEQFEGNNCSHLNVVEQIESGDPAKAEAAIRGHLMAE